jgi:membrane complex biogenesis BtpA family protein
MNTPRLLPQVEGCALIGMVHLLPLPGSPRWAGSMQAVLDAARRDAAALAEGGCDALLVENMHDLPYLKGELAPETVAAAALATQAVVALGLPTGLQLLAAANRQALGVAAVCGASFVRVEGFAYAHVADEGWIDACAGPLLRARRDLGAQVQIWADVQKKHAAHAVTGDLGIADLAHGAAFCGADALIITGKATGAPTDADDLREAAHAGLPLCVGSGVTERDLAMLAPRCQGVIVGSWIKDNGDWRAPVNVARVQRLRAILG